MTVKFEIPMADEEEWLGLLKPYQRSIINVFLKEDSLEEAAEKWLSTTGSPNIVPFGGNQNSKPFWDRFSVEVRKFLCDDEAYVEEKKLLSSESEVSKAILVSTISAAIGATLGFTATLLAPPVTLLICSVGRIGINAYCNFDS
ncbi:hypothetical protein KBY78_14020 [Synechococcus sp. EJ6-Ellesmere]|nr:hypothetical protein [Synechococcus sp. EJ6-Ellesmere]